MGSSKQTKRINIICLCLIFVAAASRGVSLEEQWFSYNSIICAAFSAAAFLWLFQIQRRVIRREERKYLMLIVLFIVFLMVIRTIKYEFSLSGSIEERYLWYLYYVPQTLIVLFMFFTVLYIGKPLDSPISRWWKLLYIPAGGICLGILTNDFHQLAFRFPDGLVNGRQSYIHGPFYFLSVIWMVILFVAFLSVVFRRCAVPENRGKMWMPMIPLACGLIYFLSFFVNPDFFVLKYIRVPEMLCLLFASFMEMLILAHLIPSNDNYGEFWEVSSIGAGIMNEEGEICYKSGQSVDVSPEQIRKAQDDSISLQNDNLILRSHKVHGGFGFWIRDISEINHLNREMMELGDVLEQENALLNAQNKIAEEEARIQEQNQLYDAMAQRVCPQLDKISGILQKPFEDELQFENNMKYACVLNAYVKRCLNLQLMSYQNKQLDVNELWLSVSESLEYVRLCGINALCTCQGTGNMPGEQLLVTYELFESVMEELLPEMDAILVHLEVSDKEFLLQMEIERSAHSRCTAPFDVLGSQEAVKLYSEKVHFLSGTVRLESEGQTDYLSVCFPAGGENP